MPYMLSAAGDFGIAKQLLEAGAQAHTMVGTPYYMAPELLQVGLLRCQMMTIIPECVKGGLETLPVLPVLHSG
jgi:serine/threonine protein kinase